MRRKLFALGFAASVLVAALALASAQEAVVGSGVIGGTSKPVASCTITSVSLSANSFAGSSPSGTVIGSIGVGTTGLCGAASLSLSGTDAAKFQIVGTNLETNGVVAGGTYSINIIATIAGATGSPFTQPETITGTTYVGSGDLQAWSHYYGFRAYTAAQAAAATQPLVNVRNGTTAETCDVLVTYGGGLGLTANCSGSSNGVSLSTFKGAANIYATKWYDITGNGCDVSQATTTSQPQIILSGINSLPTIQWTTGSQHLTSTCTVTPATGTWSMLVVYERVSGATTNNLINENGTSGSNNYLRVSGTANKLTLLTNGDGSLSATANDAVTHTVIGIEKGAGSSVDVDATTTSGTINPNTNAGNVDMSGNNSQTAYESEVGFVDNVVLDSTHIHNLGLNASTYWGTGGSW